MTDGSDARDQQLDDALSALGIKPGTLVFRPFADAVTLPPPARRSLELVALDDRDWNAILASGLLPDAPSQAHAIDNRTALRCILTVIAGKPWTALRDSPITPEAARKKFARFAELGVWRRLAEWAASADVSPPTQRLLQAAHQRAAQLKS
jgi:hypothetical protein